MRMPTIDDIIRLDRAPEPFQPGDAPFWDDPHISEGLLRAHLDDATEAASRPSSEIDGAVAWLGRLGLLRPGARVLDLGCGPGLYAERMARAGCAVTGMDISPRSIAHARERAERGNLPITYRVQDFLQMEDVEAFEVALQAYGELSTFDDATRNDLLRRIHRALTPGRAFVFDVSTPLHRRRAGTRREWSSAASGFWRPHPYVVLQAGYSYPEDVWCDQYLVVDEAGVTAYRMWFRDYTPETLSPMLERAGFEVERIAGSLTGDPYTMESEWIAVVARKRA
jgi:SAM-dependent methyltransferase